MEIVPEDFIRVTYQGIVNIRGSKRALPVILLNDAKERTMAVPLGDLEYNLIRHTLDGNKDGPQPYQNLIACLLRLGVTFRKVHILYSDEYDLPTQLILRPASGPDIEVPVPCADGIICAQMAHVPIYVSERLISAIGTEK